MTININTITEEILAKINEDRVTAGYKAVTTNDLAMMLVDMAKAARIRRDIRDGYGNEENPFYGADITGEEIANIAYWLWKNIGYTSSVQRLINEKSIHAISDRTCGDAMPGGAKINKGIKHEWVGEWTYSLDIQPIMIIDDGGHKRLAIPVTDEQLVTFARFFEIKDAQHRALSFHENYCRMSEIGRRSLFPITFTVNASYANKSRQFLSCNAEGKIVKKTWNRTLQYNSNLLNPASSLAYEAFEDMATGYVQNGEEMTRSVLYKAVNFGRGEGKYAVDAMGDYLCNEYFNGIQALVDAGVINGDCKDRQKTANVINEYLLAWCDYSCDAHLFGRFSQNGNRYGGVGQTRFCMALGLMASVIDSIHADGDDINRENMHNKLKQCVVPFVTKYSYSLRDIPLYDSARGTMFGNIRTASAKIRNARKSNTIVVDDKYIDNVRV